MVNELSIFSTLNECYLLPENRATFRMVIIRFFIAVTARGFSSDPLVVYVLVVPEAGRRYEFRRMVVDIARAAGYRHAIGSILPAGTRSELNGIVSPGILTMALTFRRV